MTHLRALIVASLVYAGSSAAFGLTLRHFEYAAILRDANSKVLGYASIEPSSDNKTSDITIQLNHEKAGTVRQWEVRNGTCIKPGTLWGNPSAYKTLTAPKTGASKQKANIAIRLPESGEFHVTIYESGNKAGKVFLCADFYVED